MNRKEEEKNLTFYYQGKVSIHLPKRLRPPLQKNKHTKQKTKKQQPKTPHIWTREWLTVVVHVQLASHFLLEPIFMNLVWVVCAADFFLAQIVSSLEFLFNQVLTINRLTRKVFFRPVCLSFSFFLRRMPQLSLEERLRAIRLLEANVSAKERLRGGWPVRIGP